MVPLLIKKEKVKCVCASFSKSLCTHLFISSARPVLGIFIRIARLLIIWKIMLPWFGKIA